MFGSVGRTERQTILRPRTAASSVSARLWIGTPSSQISPSLGESRPASSRAACSCRFRSRPRSRQIAQRNFKRNALQNIHAPRAVLDPFFRAFNLNQIALHHSQCKWPVIEVPFPRALARRYARRMAATLGMCAQLHLIREPSANSSHRTLLAEFARWAVYAAGAPVADRPILVCYGDSITAGLGLPAGEAYPEDLQKLLDARGYAYKVVDQGTSGATTKDALAGLPYVLRMHPPL